jgi:hypothetical protein
MPDMRATLGTAQVCAAALAGDRPEGRGAEGEGIVFTTQWTARRRRSVQGLVPAQPLQHVACRASIAPPRGQSQTLASEPRNIEQIKFLLGHSSIQTTERYLGSEQEIEIAVNDNLGL